jgi:hypothetical protein
MGREPVKWDDNWVLPRRSRSKKRARARGQDERERERGIKE